MLSRKKAIDQDGPAIDIETRPLPEKEIMGGPCPMGAPPLITVEASKENSSISQTETEAEG
jgi:hypothetical protein